MDIIEQWAAGMGTKAIARHHGIQPRAVERALGDAGINFIKGAPAADPNELRRLHWDERMTVLAIAELKGLSRLTIERIMIAFGVPRRTIREDNSRRYAAMAPDQIRAQTAAANTATRGIPAPHGRRVKQAIGRQDRPPTHSEAIVIADLARAGIVGFDHELAFDAYNLDIAFAAERIVIEVDGGNFHMSDKKIMADWRKAAFLVKHGWCLLRLQVPTGCRPIVNSVLLPSHVASGTGVPLLLSALCRLWSQSDNPAP